MKRKWKKNKTPKIISFEEETIPRSVAEKMLVEQPTLLHTEDNSEKNSGIDSEILDKKRKLMEQKEEVNDNKSSLSIPKKKKGQKKKVVKSDEKDDGHEKPLPKREKIKKKQTDTESENTSNQNIEEGEEETSKKKESIRAMKRKKHAQLLEEKKLKTELVMQEKALNYLSKWKHCRTEWKFEKLRQIWLHHHMYDSSKVPEEFWAVLVEYFSSSKGKARDIILKDALKIIEDSPEDTENEIKISRARDIIQHLQE